MNIIKKLLSLRQTAEERVVPIFSRDEIDHDFATDQVLGLCEAFVNLVYLMANKLREPDKLMVIETDTAGNYAMVLGLGKMLFVDWSAQLATNLQCYHAHVDQPPFIGPYITPSLYHVWAEYGNICIQNSLKES